MINYHSDSIPTLVDVASTFLQGLNTRGLPMSDKYKEYKEIIINEVFSIDNLFHGSTIYKDNQGEKFDKWYDTTQNRLMAQLYKSNYKIDKIIKEKIDEYIPKNKFTPENIFRLTLIEKICIVIDEIMNNYEFGEYQNQIENYTCKLVPYLILKEKGVKELYKKGLELKKNKNNDTISFLRLIKLNNRTANMLLGETMDIEVFGRVDSFGKRKPGGYNLNFQWKQEQIDKWIKYYEWNKKRLNQKPTNQTAKYILMESHLLPLIFGLNSIKKKRLRNNFICELFIKLGFENYEDDDLKNDSINSPDSKIKIYIKRLIDKYKEDKNYYEYNFKNPPEIITKSWNGKE